MKRLYIMRGLPGGGKSTFVKKVALEFMNDGQRSIAICSTDDQFVDANGNYVFNPAMLGTNHNANQMKAARFMAAGVEVVFIDNTNTTHKEMKPYKELAKTYGYEVKEVLIGEEVLFPIDTTGKFISLDEYITLCATRNKHNVPREAIERMAKRFEK